jgi:probable rRNA maturation factor
MDSGIEFFSEVTDFELVEAENVKSWLQDVVISHGKRIQGLTYIFVDDEELAEMNESILQHDTYTDILTFPLHDDGSENLMGDVFISVDRVRENSVLFNTGFENELYRVMVHGLLHLVGFDDLDDDSEAEMRAAEDFALSLRRF